MDLQDQRVIDSGCSRHMKENMSYLTDYKEIDGGYVAFGGNHKGEKITEKGSGPDWLFDIDALTRTMNYEPIVAGTQSNGFVDPKSSHDDGSKPTSDYEKKVDEDPQKESECNAVGEKISIELPFDPKMPPLEDDSIFDFSSDDEDDGAVADMNNLDTIIQVSPIPTTRIHKDHPLDQVIGDLQSATQTRKMSKNLEEHEFIRLKDPDFPDRVYNVEKALYGLHQAPRACQDYKHLNGNSKASVKVEDGEELDVHIYQVNPKVSHLHVVKRIFSDSDYVGASLDRKSITGGYQLLRCKLISWQCKKQTVVANFITEAKYVAASSCCGQVLWIQNQLLDYSLKKNTQVPQPSDPIKDVPDEAVHKEWGDSLVRAATTASSLEVEQDSGNINEEITLVSVQDEVVSNDADKEMFDVDVLDSEEVFVVEHKVAVKKDSAAGDIVSTASAATTTTTKINFPNFLTPKAIKH
nr:putative ribonuclease H-like domain-containing protein [Tanacetum cinerariifolium]